MATKFAPYAAPDGDRPDAPANKADRHRVDQVTVRFLGTAIPVLTLGLSLAYMLS